MSRYRQGVVLTKHTDSLGFLYLARVGRDPAAALYASADWRGGDNYNALSFCTRRVQSAVHSQLDLPLLL